MAQIAAVRTPERWRLPMPAFRALLGSLVACGHDDPAIARESLAIHIQPYEPSMLSRLAEFTDWLV